MSCNLQVTLVIPAFSFRVKNWYLVCISRLPILWNNFLHLMISKMSAPSDRVYFSMDRSLQISGDRSVWPSASFVFCTLGWIEKCLTKIKVSKNFSVLLNSCKMSATICTLLSETTATCTCRYQYKARKESEAMLSFFNS